MKLKIFLASAALLAVTLFLNSTPALVSATDVKNGICNGTDLQISDTANCKPDCGKDSNGQPIPCENKLNTLIKTIVNLLSVLVGIVAVIMVIVGGFKYITSGGDSNRVSSAKNTIIYALIGLVIVALAQLIVRFVLSKVG